MEIRKPFRVALSSLVYKLPAECNQKLTEHFNLDIQKIEQQPPNPNSILPIS